MEYQNMIPKVMEIGMQIYTIFQNLLTLFFSPLGVVMQQIPPPVNYEGGVKLLKAMVSALAPILIPFVNPIVDWLLLQSVISIMFGSGLIVFVIFTIIKWFIKIFS